MSGAARFVKKVFKKKFRFQKKWWKVAAIAVIAYFTFGLAAGAMPAAGATTGTVAAGTGAAAAGGGVMTATAATATSGAAVAAGTVAGIETVTVTAAAAGGGISAAGAAGAAVGAGVAANTSMGMNAPKTQPPPTPASAPQTAKPGMLDKAKGAWKDMSFTDKLLLAKAGVDVAAAVTAPSPEEEAAAAAKWQGAYYGMTADEAAKAQGKTQFVTQQTTPQKPPATQGGKVGQRDIVGSGGAGPAVPGGEAQPGQALPPTQLMDFQSTQQQQAAPPAPTPDQVTNVGGNRDLFAQRAPGVRYLV
jgi:hypothetical protein